MKLSERHIKALKDIQDKPGYVDKRIIITLTKMGLIEIHDVREYYNWHNLITITEYKLTPAGRVALVEVGRKELRDEGK